MSATSASAAAAETEEVPEAPFPPALIEDMLKLLAKGVRAHQLYMHNNPTYLRALDLLRASFGPIWDQTDNFTL
ncbi:MAG TPA: hypothetical protein VNW46_17505, partial [Gemmatimonadaceae bacterium]|nr:hypothetical protein [Gemmatimonadaceae bacterium]